MVKKLVDDFLYEDLTYTLRGCFFNVSNQLGYGHKEVIYQKALAVEFEKAGLDFEKEKSLSVLYDDKKVGVYRPDFLVENKIIVEVKAVPVMPTGYERQLTYYLKGTNIKLGFMVNFGSKNLDIIRRIWSPYQR